jgi:hypothetical protein
MSLYIHFSRDSNGNNNCGIDFSWKFFEDDEFSWFVVRKCVLKR